MGVIVYIKFVFALCVVYLCILSCVSQNTNGKADTTISTPTTTIKADACSNLTATCEECVKNVKCVWCSTPPASCMIYQPSPLFPAGCTLSAARWGVCWLNYEALLISCCVLGGVLLLTVACCCIYCCCCRGNGKLRRRFEAEAQKIEAARASRKVKSDERKAERQIKYDEIRAKYGLKSGSENQYQRFDNVA